MCLLEKVKHSIAGGVALAIIDESLQLFVDGRTFQLIDLGLDTAGVVVGSVVSYILLKIKERY